MTSFGMSMGSIDDDGIHIFADQCLNPFQGIHCNAHGGSYAEPAPAVLACIGPCFDLDDILIGNQSDQFIILVNNRQFLDLILLEDLLQLWRNL